MKTLNDIQNANSNAANVASNNKINDFGQKIGGARKDLYQAAHEWAAQLADIISEARKAERWSANGKYNYGPIESLRETAYKHTTTAEEYTKFFDEHLNEVTNAETYCVWLLRGYDITVDETQVYCDLRRAFPSIGFKEACKLITDHIGENQQGNGIAAALVPDFVLIESNDQNTRKHFRKRHEKYTRTRAEGWNADKLRKCYDLESLAVHS